MDELAEALRRAESRIAALESAAPAMESAAPAMEPAAPAALPGRRAAAPAPRAGAPDVHGQVSALGRAAGLAGRTFLVLAGAFVLRALTDAGTLPGPLGVALGLAYAGLWIAAAERAGADPARAASAAVHGAAAVLVGFPLLLEAVTRFAILPPAVGSALLALLGGVALAVAGHRRLAALAWVAAAAAAALAIALAAATRHAAPPLAALAVLGAGTIALAELRALPGPRWLVAGAADLVALLAVLQAASGRADGPVAAILACLLLALVHAGGGAWTSARAREVGAFEAVQGALALLAGVGGAAFLAARAAPHAAVPVGLLLLALAAAAYGIAFGVFSRRPERAAAFHYLGAAAIPLALAGTALALPVAAAGPAWAAAAVALALGARLRGHAALAGHAALYAVAAAIGSGLLRDAARALVASPSGPWPGPAAAGLAALTSGAAVLGLVSRGGAAGAGALARAPRVALLAALVAGGAGAAAALLVPAFAGTGEGASPAAAATVRTAVLSAGAVGLALLSRVRGLREAGWLVYPLLALVGLKLLLEDLPRGRPATLVVGFALYGAALLLAPRLRARAGEAGGGEAGGATAGKPGAQGPAPQSAEATDPAARAEPPRAPAA